MFSRLILNDFAANLNVLKYHDINSRENVKMCGKSKWISREIVNISREFGNFHDGLN